MDFEHHAVAKQHQVPCQNRQVLFMLGFTVANKVHPNPLPHRSLLRLGKAIPKTLTLLPVPLKRRIPEREELIDFVDPSDVDPRLSIRDVLSTKLS